VQAIVPKPLTSWSRIHIPSTITRHSRPARKLLSSRMS
jgi:hypothetical protein